MPRFAAPFLAQFARSTDVPARPRYVQDDAGLLRRAGAERPALDDGARVGGTLATILTRTDADQPDPDVVRGASGRTAHLAVGLGTDIVTVAPDPDVIRFASPRGR
ncbi:MAG: hypothetical protein HIU82_01150 [Proteobacteria bacterium]|nr:hypothetical protein [Pseudomonadota bacterium]